METDIDDEHVVWTQRILRYRSLIIRVLRPFEIIVSGIFNSIIPIETEREIYKLDKDGQQEAAAAKFIDALLDADDVNEWKRFRQEIEKPEHELIQAFLLDDREEDIEVFNQFDYIVNTVFHERIITTLDPFSTAVYCFEKTLLTTAEFQKVKACNTNHGAYHAIVLLLTYIHRSKDWHAKFLQILWDMGHKELVNDIDPKCYAKLNMQEHGTDEKEDVQETVTYYSGHAHASHNLLDAPGSTEHDCFQNIDTDKMNSRKPSELDDQDMEAIGEDSNMTDDLMLPELEKIVVKDKPFKLMDFQNELAESALWGKNVIICAPTGSGKTYVALQIIADHMTSVKGRNSKTLFLVNQIALAEQQYSFLKEHLGEKHHCIQVNGDANLEVPFKILVQRNDVLVVTAQIILDALDRGDIDSIRVFSLIIFDECHHTKDKHPFNSIMLRYMKEKYPDLLDSQQILSGMPQIVGFTASVGVGKAKKEEDAVKHIRQLCANLDVAEICTVEKNKEELWKYAHIPEHSIITCCSRGDDEFKRIVDIIMSLIEQKMRTFCEKVSLCDLATHLPSVTKRWSPAYFQWISKMLDGIVRIEKGCRRRPLVSALTYLKIYYKSLTLNEDCRTEDAFRYLEKKFNALESDQGDNFILFETELHELFERHKTNLENANTTNGSENPKLKCLQSLIRRCFHDNPDSRSIVFVKTKKLANALEQWMRETPDLKLLNPGKMVGKKPSAETGGMTKIQQVDVMQCFQDGRNKIIVATPVAQEGLNVPKCNMIIQYDHNTNEISMIQARGRARAENSQYAVIASKESPVEQKEEINLLREKLMNEAIQTLKKQMKVDVDSYEKLKTAHQLTNLVASVTDEISRQRNLREGEFKLTCLRCDHLACFSSGIRLLKDSQRIVVDPDFVHQIKVKEHSQPKLFRGLERKGKIHCICGDDWGAVIKYDGHFYPAIKISSFIVSDSLGSIKRYQQWKDVDFIISPFEIDDKTCNIDYYCDCLLR